MSNGSSDFQTDLTWIVILGLVFILGTGRGVAHGGEEPIVIS